MLGDFIYHSQPFRTESLTEPKVLYFSWTGRPERPWDLPVFTPPCLNTCNPQVTDHMTTALALYVAAGDPVLMLAQQARYPPGQLSSSPTLSDSLRFAIMNLLL